MACLAKSSRQKFFRPIIATFRAPLDFELASTLPVIILSYRIASNSSFLNRPREKILSLSLSLFSFLPHFPFSPIYKKNLTTKILPIEEVRFIGELLLTRSTTPIQNQQEIYSFNSLVLFTREKSHVFQHPRVDTGKKKFAMNLSLHFSSIRFRSTAHGSSFASRYIDPPTFDESHDEYLSTRSLFFPSSILPRVYHRSSFF